MYSLVTSTYLPQNSQLKEMLVVGQKKQANFPNGKCLLLLPVKAYETF